VSAKKSYRKLVEPFQERGLQITRQVIIGAGLPKPVGVHIMTPQALNARYGATEFSVCSAEFHFCFGLIFPFYPHSSFLEWQYVLCAIICWEYVT
jgi:hypothetical protein